VITEQEFVAALERTDGITAGHAAELAAAHHGRLPADVDRIPLDLRDPDEAGHALRQRGHR